MTRCFGSELDLFALSRYINYSIVEIIEVLFVTPFAHHMPTRLIFGPGSIERLSDEVARIRHRCLIVTGRRSARLSGLLEKVQDALLSAQIESVLFDQVEPNPTLSTITDGAKLAQEKQIKWILGIGGGSALDAAKAIALTAANGSDIKEFVCGARPARPPLPLVVVPTTSGTGSEVTPYSVVTDPAECDKFGISNPHLFPRVAILDPELTTSMPEKVSVDTGLDALSHAVEALLSSLRSPFSDMYATEAIELVFKSLPSVREDGSFIPGRSSMQLAACLAGMAITDARTLVPHALSYPITVFYDIPHGRACCLLLPAFLERLSDLDDEFVQARVTKIGGLLGNKDDAPDALRSFMESVGVAPRLGAYGVQDSEIERFAKQSTGKGHLDISPGEWSMEDLLDLYRRSL